MDNHSLKMHAVKTIEEAIAKALSDLTGKNVGITIGQIDFESGAWIGARTKFDVAMTERPALPEGESDLPEWVTKSQP